MHEKRAPDDLTTPAAGFVAPRSGASEIPRRGIWDARLGDTRSAEAECRRARAACSGAVPDLRLWPIVGGSRTMAGRRVSPVVPAATEEATIVAEDRLHVVFGAGQVGCALTRTPGRARCAGADRVAPAAGHAAPTGSTGGPPTSPTPRPRPTLPRAHRSSTNVSTPRIPSGPSCSRHCSERCCAPPSALMRCW